MCVSAAVCECVNERPVGKYPPPSSHNSSFLPTTTTRTTAFTPRKKNSQSPLPCCYYYLEKPKRIISISNIIIIFFFFDFFVFLFFCFFVFILKLFSLHSSIHGIMVSCKIFSSFHFHFRVYRNIRTHNKKQGFEKWPAPFSFLRSITTGGGPDWLGHWTTNKIQW